MSDHVLVTGGGGFIGSHLVDALLARGDRVTVWDRVRGWTPKGAHYLYVDITCPTPPPPRDVSVICHLAAQSSNAGSWMDPEDDADTNIFGTIEVERARLSLEGLRRFVYASSMTVYGNPPQPFVDEQSPCVPQTPYGISKYAGERYILSTMPTKAIALRMFNVYGPRQTGSDPNKGVISRFIYNIQHGEPIVLHGGGHQVRDFIYIDDVIQAWLLAIDSPVTGVFNVGRGIGHPIAGVANKVYRVMNHQPQFTSVPARPGDQTDIIASIGKIREHLGWTPQVSLFDGIHKTVKEC